MNKLEGNKAGIYKITNIKTMAGYIGQSINVKERIAKHKYALNKGIHTNKYLQASYKKNGKEFFKFEVIYLIENETDKHQIVKILNEKEKELINEHKTFIDGYNLTTGGDNYVVSDLTKQRLSDSHKGQVPSELCRIKTSQRFKGVLKSIETKEKMSKASKGKAKNYPAWNKGKSGYKTKPATEERKLKISLAQIGDKNHNYGKKTSDIVKQKCRDSYHGEQCHLAKLTDFKVIEIKKRLKNNESGVSLAKKYNVDPATINKIKLGKIWKHIILDSN
jgi:group I intron endonuclease